jgi:hypothetical protein
MVALLLERGALADQHAGGLGVMTAWQMFLLDICTSSRSNQSFDKSGAWQVAQSFLKHRADRQVKIPLAKIVADISVEGNFGVEITREYERTTTHDAGLAECLGYIEQPEYVEELLAGLPEVAARTWTVWRPWSWWAT